MSALRFEIIKELGQVKKIWGQFTPDRHIFDLWDFRFVFYKYFQFPLYCIVGYDGDTPIGILPLQFNTETKVYEFFGGYFMEENTVFVSLGHEETIPAFYEQVPTPALLGGIMPNHVCEKAFPLDDYKYVLPLAGINTFEDYLNTRLKSSARSSMRYRVRKTEDIGIRVEEGDPDGLNILIDFNLKHFGAESSFHYPYRKEIYHDLTALSVEVYILTYIINDIKEGASIALKYKNKYISFNKGSNSKQYPTLPTYMTSKNIEYAIQKGATEYDVLMGNYGWKESWHFDKIPQNKLEKK